MTETELETKVREILAYAKQAGWIDIAPGVRLFTRAYLRGRMANSPALVEVSPGHAIELLPEADIEASPYVMFCGPESSGGTVESGGLADDENAVFAIQLFLMIDRI